ncbi:MAG: hypothetical protein JXR37_18600 [Kiritimatiellae bacterium]|nr:hypothetical protein [Kiritimatiellia bacterium]
MSNEDASKNGGVPPKTDPLNGHADKYEVGDRKTTPLKKEEPDKDKTSRIPLDAADAEPPADQPAPKTIRLKRPSSPSTVKLPRSGGESAADDEEKKMKGMTSRIVLPEPESVEDTSKSATQRIEIPTSAPTEQAGGATRRKTIRIKRPEAPSTVRSVTIARTAEEAAKEAEAASAEDEPGVIFLLASIAAVIIVGVLVYALCIQVFQLDWPFWGQVQA